MQLLEINMGDTTPVKSSIDKSPDWRPFEHIRYAYPEAKKFDDEFVWLETVINSPGKILMWTIEEPLKDGSRNTKTGLFAEAKTMDLIKGKEKGRKPNRFRGAKDIDEAKKVSNNTRHAIGAHRYMRNAKIATISKQRDRMSAILGKMDTELTKHQDPNKIDEKYEFWASQGLEKAWKVFIDERSNLAKSRLENDLQIYLDALNAEWGEAKNKATAGDTNLINFRSLIEKLDMEWKREKAAAWVNPV